MFLSKIWFILIAFVAAVAVTVALVAPRPAVRKLATLEGARLDRAQYAAEQMFKVDAHKWIDRVSKLGRDAILSESLDAATRGAGEFTVIHRTIQDRFRTLIPDLSSGGIQVLAAVDGKGRVIARVGENDKEYGDYIGGAELIADALCAATCPTTSGVRTARSPASRPRPCCPRGATGSWARSSSAPRPAPRWSSG